MLIVTKAMFRTIVISFIVFNIACHEGVIPDGHIHAIKNEVSWSANATAVFEPAFGDSLLSIVGIAHTNQGFFSEELGFSKIPPRAGIYKAFNGGAPYTYKGIGISYSKFESGGHVISEYQTLDTLYQNNFSVDEYDESSRTLKATFECRMMYVNTLNDTTYTKFINGSIDVTVEDY